ALGPRVGRARQHGVLGGEPAAALAGEERRDAVLDAGRAHHPGVAELDQRRTLGVLLVVRNDLERAELVGASAIGAHRAQATPERILRPLRARAYSLRRSILAALRTACGYAVWIAASRSSCLGVSRSTFMI